MRLDLDLVTEALPSYEIGEELGRGAWGIVIAARHRQLDRDVAIKQLPRAFGADERVRARFMSEARVLARLDHPHIVAVHDFVSRYGLCLLVMERLDGGTVLDRAERGLSPAAACTTAIAVCDALDHAHSQGVLHRDIKPENLMFTRHDVLRVTDFGMAKVLGGGATLVTSTGLVLGTPAYMAPEQLMGADLGPATDIYATAMVLYELLAGEAPFPTVKKVAEVIEQRTGTQPRPLADANPQIPVELAAVIDRALAPEPSERPQSAREFGEELRTAAPGEPEPEPPPPASEPVPPATPASEPVPPAPAASEAAPESRDSGGEGGESPSSEPPAATPQPSVPAESRPNPGGVSSADVRPEDLSPAKYLAPYQPLGAPRRRRWFSRRRS